jgi:hypothetical protein
MESFPSFDFLSFSFFPFPCFLHIRTTSPNGPTAPKYTNTLKNRQLYAYAQAVHISKQQIGKKVTMIVGRSKTNSYLDNSPRPQNLLTRKSNISIKTRSKTKQNKIKKERRIQDKLMKFLPINK